MQKYLREREIIFTWKNDDFWMFDFFVNTFKILHFYRFSKRFKLI